MQVRKAKRSRLLKCWHSVTKQKCLPGIMTTKGGSFTVEMQSAMNITYVLQDTAAMRTAFAALNPTLSMTTLSCADCIQAFLQCDLDHNTWVILPYELWLDAWKKSCDTDTKLFVRLVCSHRGHPQAGHVWQQNSEKQLKPMGGSCSSNFVFRRGAMVEALCCCMFTWTIAP